MVFLDTNPVIYFIEQPPVWGAKATSRIGAILASGEFLAVSDLVRMECLIGPLKAKDQLLLTTFTQFFTSPDIHVLSVTAAVCDRAAQIRADHGYKPLDSLHLAAAVEHGCDSFLTNDAKLSIFPDIKVEILT